MIAQDFKNFIRIKWYEHIDEVMYWDKKQVDYDIKTWYNKNEQFLKDLYKEEDKHD